MLTAWSRHAGGTCAKTRTAKAMRGSRSAAFIVEDMNLSCYQLTSEFDREIDAWRSQLLEVFFEKRAEGAAENKVSKE